MNCRIAPKQQFESLGFATKIVEKFGASVKGILKGLSAPIEKVNTDALTKVLNDFIIDLDERRKYDRPIHMKQLVGVLYSLSKLSLSFVRKRSRATKSLRLRKYLWE